jgi:DNA repair exonuclease SbcCD nuclease subunit
MKLHLLSDLHLEFAPIDLPGGDVLLLAGDIFVASNKRLNDTFHGEEAKYFFEDACAKYNKVICIAGNHEHYGNYYNTTHENIRNFFHKHDLKVVFLENSCFELNDEYVLFGSTFWTDFNNNDFVAVQAAKNGMNDFRMISYENDNKSGSLSPFDTTEFNLTARNSLKMALEFYSTKKFIVMTHHLPDMLSVDAKYGNDPLNYAYANTGLKQFILDNPRIKYWMHGHTHTSRDYIIGDCRVMCNPRGYAKPYRPEECENILFNVNHTLEI